LTRTSPGHSSRLSATRKVFVPAWLNAFARIGAALKMRVEDLQSKGSGWLIRLHEKGAKQHIMPCHHALAEALHAYIAAAGIAADKKAFLFRTSRGHGGTALADQPMTQVDAWRMVRKRALAAGILAPIGNHSFRATGITAYLVTDPEVAIYGGCLAGDPSACARRNRPPWAASPTAPTQSACCSPLC
jgi:integrase